MRTAAQLRGKVPLTLFAHNGTLELTDGRLVFTSGKTVRLDAPVGELHSVLAVRYAELYVWHGQRQLRFLFGWAGSRATSLDPGQPVADAAAGIENALRAQVRARIGRHERDAWVETLDPLVGSRPAGVRVGTPWSMWAYIVVTIAVALVLMAAIAAVVVLAA